MRRFFPSGRDRLPADSVRLSRPSNTGCFYRRILKDARLRNELGVEPGNLHLPWYFALNRYLASKGSAQCIYVSWQGYSPVCPG